MEFQTVNYIEKPLSSADLKRLLDLAGLRPYEVLRTKEDAYREYVSGKNMTDDQLLKVMAAHPELIQRPIVVRGDKAVLARDLEKLAELNLR